MRRRNGWQRRPGRYRTLGQLLGLALIAGLLQALLLPPGQAAAVVPEQVIGERAITFNAQGGNKWSYIQGSLMAAADVVALEEVNTVPDKFEPAEDIQNNFRNPLQNARGEGILKYRIRAKDWGRKGASGPEGRLYHLDILDKSMWGGANPADDQEIDPDTQKNAQKSMAIWLRVPLADPNTDIRVIFPEADDRKWIRSRPAFGVRVNGVWYFDIHSAAIRTNTTPNPHSVQLINAIEAAVGGEPWRALGDFNTDAKNFPLHNRYYAAKDGVVPWGTPVGTQIGGMGLDFMVANHPITRVAVTRNSANDGSDHYPVSFAATALGAAIPRRPGATGPSTPVPTRSPVPPCPTRAATPARRNRRPSSPWVTATSPVRAAAGRATR